MLALTNLINDSRLQRACTVAAVAYLAGRALMAVTRLAQDGTCCKRQLAADAFRHCAWDPIAANEERFGSCRALVLQAASGEDETNYRTSVRNLAASFAAGAITISDLLRPTSDKVFWIHQSYSHIPEGGHGVRLTVQMNLFGGSVANLGCKRQQDQLEEIYKRGEIGSFALTECGAGVLSGAVVETTATWTPAGFVINTPSDSARKFWISNGIVARWSVVVARLIVPRAGNEAFDRSAAKSGAAAPATTTVDLGPHVFLIDLDAAEKSGNFVREDMERKVAFNSLDNALFTFKSYVAPHDTLLSRISDVEASTGKYSLADPKQPFRFEHMAQRLLSGRICIAHAALCHVHHIVDELEHYSRPLMTGATERTELRDLPAMRSLLAQVTDTSDVLRVFVNEVEARFRTCPEAELRPLSDRIACAKILVLDFCIGAIYRLKDRVGSYCLQKRSPFGVRTDVLYIYQFAEGDSGILKQKMARELVQAVIASPVLAAKMCWTAAFGSGLRQQHAAALLRLAVQLAGCSKDQMRERWFKNHELIERIARTHCILEVRDVVLRAVGGNSPQLERFEQWYGYH